MTNPFVEKAHQEMGPLERLFNGLPLIRDYRDKKLRREADRRLRQMLARELEQEKQRLYDVQKKLMHGGGLHYLDDADGAIQRLQTFIDQIKTASYGYAGLFAAVKVQAEQLDALHRFDVALAEQISTIKETVDRIETAATSQEEIGIAINAVNDSVTECQRIFASRSQVFDMNTTNL